MILASSDFTKYETVMSKNELDRTVPRIVFYASVNCAILRAQGIVRLSGVGHAHNGFFCVNSVTQASAGKTACCPVRDRK
jgi:hypothetical protein